MPGLLVKTADSFASCYPIVPCRNNVMIIYDHIPCNV